MGTDERYRLAVPTGGADGPFQVYDATGQRHIPLTAFGRAIAAAGQPAAARSYAYVLFPFFAFLDTDPVQRAAGRRWDSPPGEIRAALRAYLTRHADGRQYFLVALRRFYTVQHDLGGYRHEHPLSGPVLSAPVTPASPRPADERRRDVGDDIADPHLHARLLLAGRRVGWGLRERCIARIALEGGAGPEVVLGLTLGDWIDRGMGRELVARAVGRDRRVRVLRVAPLTARLLHQYGETARKAADPDGLGLAEHRRLVATAESDPDALPLFLTVRGTPLRPATFRDRAWRPACAAADLTLEPRDARRWYASQATRLIRETVSGPTVVAAALRDLAAYLRGVRGPGAAPDLLTAAVAATAAHARIQDRLHGQIGDDLGRALVTALRDAA